MPGSEPPRLLIVHHTPSPAVRALVEAARNAASQPGLSGVAVRLEPALSATASDVLACQALLLITPANIGYMSGALKHFFDTVYYPCLDAAAGLPWGVIVHGNDDTTGAVKSVERIADALRWRRVVAPLSVVAAPTARDLAAAGEVAATLAAVLVA